MNAFPQNRGDEMKISSLQAADWHFIVGATIGLVPIDNIGLPASNGHTVVLWPTSRRVQPRITIQKCEQIMPHSSKHSQTEQITLETIADLGQQALLLTSEAAQALRISPRTMERWRSDGVGPVHIKIGESRVAYKVCDILEFANG
jgi:hypothetical protein